MRVKILSIMVLIISLVFLLNMAQDSHSQPPGGRPGQVPPCRKIIQPNEIAKTLDEVKQKPTTNETFDKRVEVIETWIILSAMSGKGEEIIQTAPAGVVQNIKRLKIDDRESEAFKSIDELFLKMENIGLPQRPEATPRPPESGLGKCCDGICDDFERTNPNLCPQDCKQQKYTESKISQKLIL